MKKKDVCKVGKNISKSEAKKWVKHYQKANPDAQTHGWLYGKDILEKLCSYEGAEGIWFFKGINDCGTECLVLYPADAEGNILNNKEKAAMKSLGAAASTLRDDDDPSDLPADNGETCPPFCPKGGPG